MLDLIRRIPSYQLILTQLGQPAAMRSEAPVSLGLLRAARLPLAASLLKDTNKPVVILTDRSDRGLVQADESLFWVEDRPVLFFPEPNPMFYEPGAWGAVSRTERIRVLTLLAQYHFPGGEKPPKPPFIIVPVRALMTKTIPLREFLRASQPIQLNQTLSPDLLRRQLVFSGYEQADTVTESGQFSMRGGICDIWPPLEASPIRIEFFGDEIDTLRSFDPSTQRKIDSLNKVRISPARETARRLERNSREEPSPAEPGALEEFSIPQLYPICGSLLDFLPLDTVILVDDLAQIESVAAEIEEQAIKLRADSIQEGTLSAAYPLPYTPWSELFDGLYHRPWLDFGRGEGDKIHPVSEAFYPGERFAGRLKDFIQWLDGAVGTGERSWIVSRQVRRIQEIWQEAGNQRSLPNLEFAEGSLSDGFRVELEDQSFANLVTDSEIFGWERPQTRLRARQSPKTPEADYIDLQVGDYVVHVDHGIGRYAGLVNRTVDGQMREFLAIEYQKKDVLYVPIYQADRLSRYVGPSGEAPELSQLGGTEWHSSRARVKDAVLEVAQDLLELYAKRHESKGFAFPQDAAWQAELETSFPYIETADQKQAIEEVKNDMERARPMDRLLCGDVGYGKTEVALRAAFKAVMAGKQVGILVPTTVLAQQHYDTFCQRLAPFPVQVEMLSRFRTAREQDEIVRKLRAGQIDIVIGTHRVLQQDVQFKDLGLVIIDEEQRFGVTHKEFLKKLRTEVDVLTLTATPIPRTLYMALTGVRDISQINTPPAERLPIITHIGPYSPNLVRQAIIREIERGGQVFFVHNRVQTIRGMEQHLTNLVPQARIGIAHGQMNERQLAQVMEDFTHGSIDVLLCTSIIESGLDIPNANTLIVDRGDAFGLAQLYQLRGRVGRGAQRAYAYFFKHRRKAPTPEGQERLEVIAENNQLGAGYSIAMRDLEMRGAGELLGSRQHGMIAAVGFHLYTRMLAQAVNQIRTYSGIDPQSLPPVQAAIRPSIASPVSVELPLGVGIPEAYIADLSLRLKLYRRMAEMVSETELEAMREEFQDRFGPLPEPVEDLFFQIQVKILAGEAGLAAVAQEGDQIVLRYPALPPGVRDRSLKALPGFARSGKNAYWMFKEPLWRRKLIDTLHALVEE